MYIYNSTKENEVLKKFEKRENSFSIGISIGYTDYF